MAIIKLKVAQMTGLWRVRSGKTLVWPQSILSPGVTKLNARGRAGYIVDLDEGYEKALLFGMEHQIEKVPEGQVEEARKRVPDPHSFPRPVQNNLADKLLIQRRPIRRKPSRTFQMAARSKEQTKPDSAVPALDEAPKGRTTRRRRGGPSDVAEGKEVTDGE